MAGAQNENRRVDMKKFAAAICLVALTALPAAGK
jgi:hypothetical protein